MSLDWRHWALTHLVWIVAVVIGGIGIHTYIQEHDARVKAEATLKADEGQVATLQQQITANTQTIAQLQTQIQNRDAQNAKVIASLTKQRATAVTPPQQVTVLQTEAKLPEPITSIPNSVDWRLPANDVAPLFGAVNDGLQAEANLATCTDDLSDTKKASAAKDGIAAAQVAQLALKDNEIAVLKKKPAFWHRVGSTLKKVGIGVGIGIGIAVLVH
jgi:hypothetical protein